MRAAETNQLEKWLTPPPKSQRLQNSTFRLINGLIGSFLAFYSALGLWLMAQGSWLMTHGSWLMTHGLWLMAHVQSKIWRGVPQAPGPRAKFFIGHEP